MQVADNEPVCGDRSTVYLWMDDLRVMTDISTAHKLIVIISLRTALFVCIDHLPLATGATAEHGRGARFSARRARAITCGAEENICDYCEENETTEESTCVMLYI